MILNLVRHRLVAAGFAAAIAIAAVHGTPAVAAHLRVASASDSNSLDPHSFNNVPANQLLRQIYESLVSRNQKVELEPGLAESWELIEPTRWRFKLREGVTFHDGAPFTAEDVVFSLTRAGEEGSNFRNFVDLVETVEVVDDTTVDIVTSAPDPILPDKIASVLILNKAWAEQHDVTAPVSATAGGEAYSVRNANGTGPFRVVSREQNVRTVLERYDGWWGETDSNVTRYISIPISAPATRVAALLSNEVDLVLDPPLQDLPRLEASSDTRILKGPEIRTMFLVLDQERDELLYSDVKGKNPFKDRRVRQALYQAIDIEAITSRLQQGYAKPAGILFGPGVRGYAEDLDERLPHDVEAAKRLLAEAGYPDGFGVTIDCPNNRYINDAEVCASLAPMWARIGVKLTVNAIPLQVFSPKTQQRDTSLFFLGSGSPTLDGFYMIQIHLMGPGKPGDGLFNRGGYNNPELNAIGDKIRTETDLEARDDLIRQALEIYKEDVIGLPLYHQEIAWALRSNVETTFREDNLLEARYVRITE